MNNKEIDIRLRALADYLPKHFEQIKSGGSLFTERTRADMELELLNMSMVAIFSMLGEIAKRLPEDTFQYESSVDEVADKAWEKNR